MTDAEKAVLNDVLCSVTSDGVLLDAATIRAMMAGPALLKALCAVALEFGRDMDIDEREVFRLCDAAMREAHGRGVYESQTLSPLYVSPAEKPTAQSTPQPLGETPCWNCDDRGWTVGWDNEHIRCEECRGPLPAPPRP